MSQDDVLEIEGRLVLEAIFERYGYDLRGYEQGSMTRRLRAALARSGLPHFGELQHRLIHDAEFFASTLEDLTVQVSEMFRDPPFYRFFRQAVVPVLRTYPEVKIWHAGCASGEEVYATAIVLLEEGLYERAQIYATDMSARALERARHGAYSEAQADVFAKNYREAGGGRNFSEYSASAYGRIIMREQLRKNVIYFQHNLVSDYSLGEMQVIFCRNVLIYFGEGLRERVVTMFSDGLCRGGFLCLGANEHLPVSSAPRLLEFVREARIYRKRGIA